MSQIIVIPKRKMLPIQEDTTQTPVVSPPSTVIPTANLSNLLIDTSKSWSSYSIESLGQASDNYGAARKVDLDTAIAFTIDGGGAAITTGIKGDIRLPFAGTIISVALSAPKEAGSIVIDVWKDTTANYPPTIADTITAAAKPTLVAARISLDAVLTGWTKTFAVGDYLLFTVDSITTVTLVTLVLLVRRT